MAGSSKDKQLLSTFPCPPTDAPLPSPSGLLVPSPKPSPMYRPSDFGFIQVGLPTEDDHASLHEHSDPVEKPPWQASAAPIPISLPSPNLGGLKLILDNPSKIYSPLETITGYVFGWVPSSHIHIVLEGRAKSHITIEHMTWKDRAPFLYQITHLKPEDHGAVPRFSIEIPDKVQPNLIQLDDFAPKDRGYAQYWTHGWPAEENYECQAGHPLPPSMILPRQSTYQITSRIWGHGYISYRLIVIRSRFDRTTGKLVPEAECQIPIRLTTLRLPRAKLDSLTNASTIRSEDLEVRTTKLAQAKRISLCHSLRDSFSASTPSFHFSPSISIPNVCTPGDSLPVQISISILPPPVSKLYNFSIPNITVSSFSCLIRSHTGVRVLAPASRTEGRSIPTRNHTFKKEVVYQSSAPKEAVFRPKDGDFEKQSCTFTIILPKTVSPSFKTYSFWRGYRVKCEVGFKVAGKEVSVETKTDLSIVASAADDAINTEVENISDDGLESLQIAKALVGGVSLGGTAFQGLMALAGG